MLIIKFKEFDRDTSKKIDWHTYMDNLPIVLWDFWFYFWNLYIEIKYFKNSLTHYNRGTGLAIIPPQRALFNFLIPSHFWNYVKKKKEVDHY